MSNRNWARYQKYRHIKKKKRITKEVYHTDNYFNCDGKYDSFKVHCSCMWCSCKSKNKGKRRNKRGNYADSYNWSIADRRKFDRMDQSEEDFNECINKFDKY